MTYVLASYNQDAAMTVMREALGEGTVDGLFPYVPPLGDPVIPPGTPLDFDPVPVPAREGAEARGDGPSGSNGARAPEARTGPAAGPDPEAFGSPGSRTRPGVGSYNWAVSGRLTASGSPILCNDMHLELLLPAVWYEVQLAAPGVNVRGVAFPAAPSVIAGYNEDIAWGFTNGTDDVIG